MPTPAKPPPPGRGVMAHTGGPTVDDRSEAPHMTVRFVRVAEAGAVTPVEAVCIGWSDRPGTDRGPHDDDVIVSDPAVYRLFRDFRGRRFPAG